MSRSILVVVLLAISGLAGCQSYPRIGGHTAQKPPCGCGAPPADVRITPIPMPRGSAFPPASPMPRQTAPPPRAEELPPAPPATTDRQPPVTNNVTPPAVQIGTPGPLQTETAKVPNSDPTRPPEAALPKGPTATEERETPPPTDVPGYILVRPNVATGLKPFPDGVKWLKDRGFKSALHLRAPGEDSAAAKRLFEKKGLTYLTLEVSPTTLTKEAFESFVKEVIATANHPMYVFDRNGSMVSAMWYLYFRAKMELDDEKALAEIKRIGLKVDDDDDHKKAWLAAQTLLSTLKP